MADKQLEYKVTKILASAVRLAKLIRLEAPRVILEHEHKVLSERLTDFLDGKVPLMSTDDMQGSVNYSDYTIIEGIIQMYDRQAILDIMVEVDNKEAERDA